MGSQKIYANVTNKLYLISFNSKLALIFNIFGKLEIENSQYKRCALN